MKEVVKKEVQKLLEAGMIYPISDSLSQVGGCVLIIENSIKPQEKIISHYPSWIKCWKDWQAKLMTAFWVVIQKNAIWMCNAPATFQRCMFAIFADLLEKGIEVFMDDFSVYGTTFSSCLKNLDTVLKRRFIKDFSKIAKPLCNLLNKDTAFNFDENCFIAFKNLKEKLISAPIITAPNWLYHFELMCDASDYAVGAVLGQRKENFFHVIHYASKVLNDAQSNYTTTEKELLAIVYALEKFRSYLIGSKVIVFTDHAQLDNLIRRCVTRNEAKNIYGIVTIHHMEVISMDKGQQLKCYNLDFIGQLCSKMHMNMFRSVIVVKELELLQEGPLPSSFSNEYILLAVEYVSRWVEAAATQKADAKTVIKFLKEIFSPGLEHYGVRHKVATAYHPQTNGQAEVSNREIKKILEKTVSSSRKDWLRLFPGKLKSKWSGPFQVKQVKPYGAVELEDPVSKRNWVVNGQRLKHYFGGEVERHTTMIHFMILK
ncbi:uncharacterized protein [Phaseolus vulgaris]|uniref:uncharacterized protein n=1 Tax=Phaseolus vulgaris TaxID=3885 RepID=UPI0035C99E6F